jgi:hypothetical protein
MKPLSFLLAIAALGSCASQTVYLSQLRDSDAGSQDSQAYDTLQEAVILANDFLANSPSAKGYPASKELIGVTCALSLEKMFRPTPTELL